MFRAGFSRNDRKSAVRSRDRAAYKHTLLSKSFAVTLVTRAKAYVRFVQVRYSHLNGRSLLSAPTRAEMKDSKVRHS